MSAEERWGVACRLYRTARELKAAWLREQHPDWQPEAIEREVTRAFLHAAG